VRLRKTEVNAENGDGRAHPGRRQSESEASGPRDSADNPFAEGSSSYSPQEVEEMYGRVNYEFISPPRMALTFRFTNTGTQPVTFKIADVNSTLGNFAPRPETLTVAPGQTGTVDPMLSNMTSNFETLDVSLTIKIGKKDETQILKLHRAPDSGAAPHTN
jgi:hypothetical protein